MNVCLLSKKLNKLCDMKWTVISTSSTVKVKFSYDHRWWRSEQICTKSIWSYLKYLEHQRRSNKTSDEAHLLRRLTMAITEKSRQHHSTSIRMTRPSVKKNSLRISFLYSATLKRLGCDKAYCVSDECHHQILPEEDAFLRLSCYLVFTRMN